MDLRQSLRHFIYLSGISALITGCMLGPNFQKPSAPEVDSYTETPLPKKTVSTPSAGNAGKSQTYVSNQDISADWWYIFHSPEINHLVQTGLANSPTLVAAEASLRQAQEILNAQIGNTMYPAFNATVSGQRQLISGSTSGGNSIGSGSPGTIFNTFNVTANVSYTLDFFGANRREIESLRAQVDFSQFQLIAAYLTLTSNIVTTAITIASLEEQIRVTQSLIQSEENELVIIRKQNKLGGVSLINVLTQQTVVDHARATLPVLQNSLSQSLHALSVLVGAYPNGQFPKIHLQALILPAKLPVSLPSNLVRQRPDVRAAEALIHAASAQIGVATANLFPQFTINGNYGWSALTPSTLFLPISKTWLMGGQLIQPIFQGGALLADKRKAIAAYDQAGAQYKQTVLQAFQNVADSLRALETDARTFQAERSAELAAYDNLKITKKQYKLGGVNYLNLLTAQLQYQESSLSRIKAQSTRYNDTAALFQALGGGWWNRQQEKGDQTL